jgi:hypothetical protein
VAGTVTSCVLVPGNSPRPDREPVVPVAAPGGAAPGGTAPGEPGLQAITTSVVLMRGETRDMAALLRHPDGTPVSRAVVWTTSDDAIADVGTTTGAVRAGATGRATIVATLSGEPGTRVAFEVNVVEKHAVLLVRVSPATPTLAVGRSLPLKAHVTLADGQVNGNVSWSSSDNTIATINPTTGEVTGLRPGSVTIVAAYSADVRYKGLAAITVVPEGAPVPSPTPEEVVFGPGATPLPGVVIPVTPPPPVGDATTPPPLVPDTEGTLVGGGRGAYVAPSFAAVREFGPDALFEFIDFLHVVVAEGNKLTVTRDGGRSWTTYRDVGGQPIRGMHWRSAQEGWLACENGALLKVSFQGDALSLDVRDSGTDRTLQDVYFTSPTEGLLASEAYDTGVRRTTDGGASWQGVGIGASSLLGDGLGGVVAMQWQDLYHDRSGAMAKIEVGEDTRFRAVRAVDGMAFLQGSDHHPSRWYTTTDWQAFTPLSTTVRTPTALHREGLEEVYPISRTVWFARVKANMQTLYALSRDGGQLWTEPARMAAQVDAIFPFSEAQMWATSGTRLLRAGVP